MKAVERLDQFYLIKQLPKATALLCKEGLLLDASCSWLETFGLPPINKNKKTKIFSLLPEAHNLEQKLEENKSFNLQHKVIHNNGARHLKSYFSPWFDEKENVVGTIIQTDDITEQVEKEKELSWLKVTLETKVEVSKTGWWEYDVETEKLTWCKETKRIHQVPDCYEPTAIEAFEFYKTGYSQNKVSMLFHKAVSNHQSYDVEIKMITFNGEERWVRTTGKPFLQDGKVIKIFGTIQDIHERVVSGLQTKESERLLTTLIDNIPVNVFIKDTDSRKILVNKSECDYFNKSQDELIGTTDFDLFDKESAKISMHEDLEVMRSQKPMIARETICVKKNGESTHFLTSKIPTFDIDGKVNGLMGISLDISAMKKKEKELCSLIKVTSMQNEKLINFAHIVSHNLRSHTANFSMLLDFLNSEKNQDERKRIIKMLTNASDNLLETLENLNQVVDVNTKASETKKSINLNSNITNVLNNLSAFLDKNDAKIVINVANNIRVNCVPAYLDSIISNLVSNAVKYKSPNRPPLITINAVKSNQCVSLSISDNGIGINLDKYGDKIFGMYKTFHNREDAKGFGLYLIKNQIEAMGGSITVQSEVDKGTTFNVYFNEES